MAWTTVPDVDNGASFGDSATNAYRDGIMEIQEALDLVRRRDAKSTTTYANGSTDLVPNSSNENVGGITLSTATYTVPFAGVYSFSYVLNPSSAWGVDDLIGGAVTRAGAPFFLNQQALQNTTTGNIGSWSTFMFASDTIKFTLEIAGGSIDVAWEVCVALLSPVLP